MTMMLVARAIERIGDNAVDIGEQVAFVVTGLFQGVRGRLPSRPERRSLELTTRRGPPLGRRRRLLVRNHHLRRLVRGDVRIEDPAAPRSRQLLRPAGQLRSAGTEAGAIPAKVSEKIRPTLIAGLAKLVELVKK